MNQIILDDTGHGAPSPDNLDRARSAGGHYFTKIAGITTNAATPAEVSLENIKKNIKLDYPRLHQIPEFEQDMGDDPIALVGGGPSLKDTIHELREWNGTILACGSSHDYLVSHGIIPDYCVACDPDPIMANYLTKAHADTTYLLSTALDPLVFEKLDGNDIVLWHCHSDANEEAMKELEVNYQAVGGGCTVGLRSLSMAIIMGWKNIHFFGFDSCLDGKAHHAYDFTDETKEFLGDVHRIRFGFGGPGEKYYNVAGYQLAQVRHFMDFYKTYGMYFTPTFHGTGFLPDSFDAIQKYAKTLDAGDIQETVGVMI